MRTGKGKVLHRIRGKRRNRMGKHGHRMGKSSHHKSFSLLRTDTAQHVRSQIAPENYLETLKAKAQAIEDQLNALKKRIRDMEQEGPPSALRADVNPERCTGCGICEEICPTGSITVEEIARVDQMHCVGCGHCVDNCSQGALSLNSVATGFRESVG